MLLERTPSILLRNRFAKLNGGPIGPGSARQANDHTTITTAHRMPCTRAKIRSARLMNLRNIASAPRDQQLLKRPSISVGHVVLRGDRWILGAEAKRLVLIIHVPACIRHGLKLVFTQPRKGLIDDFVVDIPWPQAVPINHRQWIVEGIRITVPCLGKPEIHAEVGRIGARKSSLSGTHIPRLKEIEAHCLIMSSFEHEYSGITRSGPSPSP